MLALARLLAAVDRMRAPETVHAHCDLPCGVYDPAQARIEADAVKAIVEKYHASKDETFRQRAIMLKEQRAELLKHHLWVLWTDYFKPEHLEQYPDLHMLFWDATKAAGASKHSTDAVDAQNSVDLVARIEKIFWETKKA